MKSNVAYVPDAMNPLRAALREVMQEIVGDNFSDDKGICQRARDLLKE
jgi:hypothetical protein